MVISLLWIVLDWFSFNKSISLVLSYSYHYLYQFAIILWINWFSFIIMNPSQNSPPEINENIPPSSLPLLSSDLSPSPAPKKYASNHGKVFHCPHLPMTLFSFYDSWCCSICVIVYSRCGYVWVINIGSLPHLSAIVSFKAQWSPSFMPRT